MYNIRIVVKLLVLYKYNCYCSKTWINFIRAKINCTHDTRYITNKRFKVTLKHLQTHYETFTFSGLVYISVQAHGFVKNMKI